ncbi:MULTISPECIES: hypothetical protein [Neobacillus]|jgi:hypothetical protein|uniref:hypothetical protein n=1 Tax=Neobacillus TaxID=2675232 RepID=UPI0027E18AB8|nr:hypothetical protein [Neobacillus sp. OS1-33]WML26077.1 hypothetical protein RCG22_25300 [Neobacillus sp. OS1-33]
MAKSKKSKWLIGVTGTALSAFVISQVGTNQQGQNLTSDQSIITNSMSKEEKDFVQLDWSNYSINGDNVVTKGVEQSDRQTSRS